MLLLRSSSLVVLRGGQSRLTRCCASDFVECIFFSPAGLNFPSTRFTSCSMVPRLGERWRRTKRRVSHIHIRFGVDCMRLANGTGWIYICEASSSKYMPRGRICCASSGFRRPSGLVGTITSVVVSKASECDKQTTSCIL